MSGGRPGPISAGGPATSGRWGLLDSLDRSRRTRVHSITPEAEALALQWLRRHDERPYSFVDATSFALMHALAIREALAFDGDFSAAGFVELRA